MISLFGGTWNLANILQAAGDRTSKAGACSVKFIGKHYVLKPDTISEKFKKLINKPVVNTYYIVFKFQVVSDTAHTHTVYIRTIPDQSALASNVQVYCDCRDFQFRSAWFLNEHNALYRSDRTDAKLGPALTTKPKAGASFTLCKHAYAALQYLQNNFQSLIG